MAQVHGSLFGLVLLSACSGPIDTLDESSDGRPVGSILQATTTVDDPLFPEQWGLYNTGQAVPQPIGDDGDTLDVPGVPGVDIKITEAWDITQGSSSVLVGLAETTDVDVYHEDFHNQIWRNRDEVVDGIDNDGNGCIDDVFGCDFMNQDGVFDPVGTHATHVAGIISARIKNGKGVVGTAPKVKLVPLTSTVKDQSFVEAIEYAKNLGVRVISISQGSPKENDFDPAVRQAMAQADILFVCSADNRATPRFNYPSSYDEPNILSVANVENTGELWRHSSYGPHVDLAAPGTAILSTTPGDEYGYGTGTSQAAPQVAGVAALIMNKFSELSVLEVRDRILRTAMRMTTLDSWVGSAAMVDAESALRDVGPLKLSATTAPGSVKLRWYGDLEATRYEVERDGVVVDNGASTTHKHAGLVVDSGHIYRVRAFHGSRTQPWSHRLFAKATRMPRSQAWFEASPHPYPNDFSEHYTVHKSGASRLRVHFSRLTSLPGDILEYERNFEFEETVGEDLYGDYPDGFWTHWVDGDTFDFDFTSDSSNTAYGFEIDRIEYFK